MHYLITRAKALKAAKEEVIKKREVWNEKTKPLLKKVFESIKAELPLEITYQNNGIVGKESVIYWLGHDYSGIRLIHENGEKDYIKDNGSLIFSLYFNGDIRIIYSKPTIQDIVSNTVQNELLCTLSPFDMDEKKIIKYFGIFLDKVTDWETNGIKKAIGFDFPTEAIKPNTVPRINRNFK